MSQTFYFFQLHMEPYQSISQLFISTNGFERIYASCGGRLRKANFEKCRTSCLKP